MPSKRVKKKSFKTCTKYENHRTKDDIAQMEEHVQDESNLGFKGSINITGFNFLIIDLSSGIFNKLNVVFNAIV